MREVLGILLGWSAFTTALLLLGNFIELVLP